MAAPSEENLVYFTIYTYLHQLFAMFSGRLQHLPELKNAQFISLSILTCINFLQCSRVVFSICLNSNFPPQQPFGYLP